MSRFWDDLDMDLKDPECRRHYLLESERIAAIDRIMTDLDTIRAEIGISKADLARAIERSPETVRRLFTAKTVNPQFSVIAQMAAALGYRISLEPMMPKERKEIAGTPREAMPA